VPWASLLLALVLALAGACARPTLAEGARVDLSEVQEVWVATAEEMLSARDPWHRLRDPEAVRALVGLLAQARQVGQARPPYAQLDGTLTLILGPERGIRTRYYGLRYDLQEKRLLDLNTGLWYAFPAGFEEALVEVLRWPETPPTP